MERCFEDTGSCVRVRELLADLVQCSSVLLQRRGANAELELLVQALKEQCLSNSLYKIIEPPSTVINSSFVITTHGNLSAELPECSSCKITPEQRLRLLSAVIDSLAASRNELSTDQRHRLFERSALLRRLVNHRARG